jgi:hypothetical protein
MLRATLTSILLLSVFSALPLRVTANPANYNQKITISCENNDPVPRNSKQGLEDTSWAWIAQHVRRKPTVYYVGGNDKTWVFSCDGKNFSWATDTQIHFYKKWMRGRGNGVVSY